MKPGDQPPSEPDWSSGTFEGSEREQLRRWSALPLRRKLEALDEMCAHARRTIASRRRRGLPYIDPETDEVVQTTAEKPALRVNEPPPADANRPPGIVPPS